MTESSLCSLDESLPKVRDTESGTVWVTDLEVDDGIAAEGANLDPDDQKMENGGERTFRH